MNDGRKQRALDLRHRDRLAELRQELLDMIAEPALSGKTREVAQRAVDELWEDIEKIDRRWADV